VKSTLKPTLWIAGVITAFFVGKSTTETSKTKPNSLSPFSQANQPIAGPRGEISSLPKQKISAKKRRRSSGAENNTTDVHDFLEKSLGRTSNFEIGSFSFLAESYEKARQLNEKEILSALNLLMKEENSYRKLETLRILMGRFAEVNPEASMEFYDNILKPHEKRFAIDAIMSTWAKENPNAALSWYTSIGVQEPICPMNGNNAIRALKPIFQNMGAKDLESAINKVSELKPSDFSDEMISSGLIGSLKTSGDFRRFLDLTKDLNSKDYFQKKAIQKWTDEDPQSAVEWARNIESGAPRQLALKEIKDAWILNDAEGAMQWFFEHNPENKTKESLILDFNSEWAQVDPREAGKWLVKHNHSENPKIVHSFIENATWSEPSIAAQWLDKVSDEQLLEEYTKQIYIHWTLKNKQQAEGFLEKSKYKDSIKKKLKDNETRYSLSS